MDSKSASAEEERPRVEDSGAVEGLARSAVQRLADHTLAAEADKERLREDAHEFVETREELEILLQGLGKAEARIDPYILDAEAVEPVEALGEVKGDVGNDIVVVAVGLHDSGEAAGVHHDIGDLRIGDKVEHIGVELTGTDVVDHVGTGLDGATSGEGKTGVDGDDGRRESLTEGGHGSCETGSLDVGRKHNGAGTRRDDAHIEDVGTPTEKQAGLTHHGMRVEETATVEERIGGDIEDAHHRRTVESD